MDFTTMTEIKVLLLDLLLIMVYLFGGLVMAAMLTGMIQAIIKNFRR